MKRWLDEEEFYAEKQKLYEEFKKKMQPVTAEYQQAYKPLADEFVKQSERLQDIYENKRKIIFGQLKKKMRKLEKRRIKHPKRKTSL